MEAENAHLTDFWGVGERGGGYPSLVPGEGEVAGTSSQGNWEQGTAHFVIFTLYEFFLWEGAGEALSLMNCGDHQSLCVTLYTDNALGFDFKKLLCFMQGKFIYIRVCVGV